MIQERHNGLVGAGPKKGFQWVRQCRIKQCRDAEKGILMYQLSHLRNSRDMDTALHFVLSEFGGDVLEGTEPPSELERSIQKDITAVQDMHKR